MSVVIETTVGDITVDLFTEERPIACLNFIKLCQLKYYNYNLFHTVEQGFIAQTGDPTGSGNGGSSIWGVIEGPTKRFFEGEYLPKIYHTSPGLLSLVSAGKNLVGSQFFFTLGANLTSLDRVHCVIGEVVEGHETLRKLNEAIVDENFRPYQDIRITHTVILHDPFPNMRGFKAPSRSPSPTPERLQNGRIAADEDIDDTDGKTLEEIQEMLAEREANARATILEIVGDLPDAEMAPPENVLFVCKLNPVTNDDDLEIIFSRFGKVKSCEVVRDKVSGDSLQFAFVEFENQKACEAAYFKMDNVLIDDRRIHVDFSQSVAKVKWRGKGRGVEGYDGRLDFNDLRGRKAANGDRSKGRRENAGNETSHMTLEDRRKAREERHRQQESSRQTKNRSRSRSRNRNYERKDERMDRRRGRSRSQSREGRRDYNVRKRDSETTRRSHSKDTDHRNGKDRRRERSRSGSRGGNRKHDDRRREEQQGGRRSNLRGNDYERNQTSNYRDRRDPEEHRSQNRESQRSSDRRVDHMTQRKRDSSPHEQRARKLEISSKTHKKHEKESKKKRKVEKNKKKKSSRRKSSSSESESTTDDSSSSTSSTSSDSSESSTSSDERRKKKKKKNKKA